MENTNPSLVKNSSIPESPNGEGTTGGNVQAPTPPTEGIFSGYRLTSEIFASCVTLIVAVSAHAAPED
jgi:hypothetical protein